MLWVPQKGEILVQHNLGDVGDATPGTQVTTGATAPVKGTAVEVFASTAFDAYWVEVYAWNYSLNATQTRVMIDLLTGAATEEVLAPNLIGSHSANAATLTKGHKCVFAGPLYIPAGSRIAVRAAGDRVSTVFSVGVYLRGGYGTPPFRVGSKVTAYGVGTVPAGTAFTPGGTGAQGAWAQITASTSEDHFAFFPGVQIATDTSFGSALLWVEMGYGAATEELIGGPYIYGTHGDEMLDGPLPHQPLFKDVPSGSRLVMRGSNSIAVESNYQGVIYALS